MATGKSNAMNLTTCVSICWLLLVAWFVRSTVQVVQADLVRYPFVQQYTGSHYGYTTPRYQRFGLTLYSQRIPFLRQQLGRPYWMSTPRRAVRRNFPSARTIAQRTQSSPLVLNQTINVDASRQKNAVPSKRVKAPRSQSRSKPVPRKTKTKRSPNVPSTAEMPDDLPWRYLAAGTSKAAQRRFNEESRQSPGDGLPRVGLAIAAALNGESRTAIRSLRRAWKEDPKGSSLIPTIPGVAQRVQLLADHFEKESDSDSDAHFMVAAMKLYLDDPDRASAAIREAIEQGDQSEATRNLNQFLNGDTPDSSSEATSE